MLVLAAWWCVDLCWRTIVWKFGWKFLLVIYIYKISFAHIQIHFYVTTENPTVKSVFNVELVLAMLSDWKNIWEDISSRAIFALFVTAESLKIL